MGRATDRLRSTHEKEAREGEAHRGVLGVDQGLGQRSMEGKQRMETLSDARKRMKQTSA